MLRSLLFSLALLTASCGGAGGDRVGSSHGALPDRPIDLTLHTVGGGTVELADQRGGLVMLFVLATYDGLSQAAVRPVSRFTRDAEDTVVLGVVVEPNAAQFADVYQSTFRPPYTVVYDDTGTIALGTSELGELPGVPTFYMIDAHGLVVDRRSGFLGEHELFAMRDRARERGGIVASAPSAEPEQARAPRAAPAESAEPAEPAEPADEPAPDAGVP